MFSACRPIVGMGDRHDVVQQVSNAVDEVTICHKVNSPHNNQVSNVVLNMCVTKVSSQLGPQKLKLARSSRAGFRAKDVTNPCQQGDQPTGLDKEWFLFDELVASLAEVILTLKAKVQKNEDFNNPHLTPTTVLLHTSGSGACSILERAMIQTLISVLKLLHGHFVQTDGS